jgi:DNA-binding NtrC family response regulator
MHDRLRVVAADAAAGVRDFYRKALTRRGHDVRLAATGRELVELCRADPPDLVITDVRMTASVGRSTRWGSQV